MNWKDISIKKYLEIQDILKNEIEDDEKMIMIANVIYGYDITELTIPEYKQRLMDLSFVNTEPEKEKLANSYTINGTKYITKSDLASI